MKKCILLLSGFVFLQGCAHLWDSEDPADYTKDKAAGRALTRLVRYADSHSVPVYEFRGPYFKEVLGGAFPAYIVCYKHPTHFFCYDDWTGNEDSGLYVTGESQTERMKWLKKQPD
ncbi:hypothetical protein [Vampirovibrio chlorellavorus]|uniref:hypothetical protein n=1 Tax=Vampirovibrio chlorellavorus TaxID=758823 RepID=UPI0026EEEA59|nr:hypothetical protein [Vampirovibrio chlorellavorus]